MVICRFGSTAWAKATIAAKKTTAADWGGCVNLFRKSKRLEIEKFPNHYKNLGRKRRKG